MVEKINIFTLLKGEKARNLREFCVVDIRGRQSFLAAHLRNSYHLPSKDEILAFVKRQSDENLGLAKSRENQNLSQSRKNPNSPKSRENQQNSPKPLLIVCFSSARARKMCEDLAASAEFAACYGFAKLHYLDCGIMEAFDNGFEICAGAADFANDNANFADNANFMRNSSGGVNFVGETSGVNSANETSEKANFSHDLKSVNFAENVENSHFAHFAPPPPHLPATQKPKNDGINSQENSQNSLENSAHNGENSNLNSQNSQIPQISPKNSHILNENSQNLAENSAKNSQNLAKISAKNSQNSAENSQNSSQIPQTQPHANPLVAATIADIKEKYLSHKKAWVVTFSGGKDSPCVLQLVYEMLCELPPQLRRETYAIASNTLVEAPHIDRFLREVVESINAHAKQNGVPFEVLMVQPSLKDDFWVNLIGKGYPSPTRTFRWCTERLKINPAKAKVAQITAKHGACILLLGSRKAESSNRKRSIEKRTLNEDGYSQHHDFPDTLTYAPIAEWDTDAVWGYLLSHKPRWDKDHSELFALYSRASGDECQFITDLAQSSCGGSRVA